MYSQLPLPPGVRNVRMKHPKRLSPDALYNGPWVADHRGDTWCVWNWSTGALLAIFHMAPNVNGWSASQAHARSYLLRAVPFNPFELDAIP